MRVQVPESPPGKWMCVEIDGIDSILHDEGFRTDNTSKPSFRHAPFTRGDFRGCGPSSRTNQPWDAVESQRESKRPSYEKISNCFN